MAGFTYLSTGLSVVYPNTFAIMAPNKKPMTPEERLELCEKLDKDLDDFIDGLERKRYEDGWPEDRWEEEMSKHPFFMTEPPAPGAEMSPLVEGLARLKFDPVENTPIELAEYHKSDGNFNFKHKNYRLAILSYTEGIKLISDINCGKNICGATLYSNRAAAHWYLSNFRSCFLDCEKALKIDPTHKKARLRAIKSSAKIRNYRECLKHCNSYLEQHPSEEEIVKLQTEAKKLAAIQERDIRKATILKAKAKESKELALKTILDRGINIGLQPGETPSISNIESTSPGTWGSSVYYENDQLWWPIAFIYPEVGISDLLKTCSENNVLSSVMEEMFPTPWDSENKYSLETINVYYGGSDAKWYKVNIKSIIKDIVKEKHFIVNEGSLAFLIVVKDSKSESSLLEMVKQ